MHAAGLPDGAHFVVCVFVLGYCWWHAPISQAEIAIRRCAVLRVFVKFVLISCGLHGSTIRLTCVISSLI